jgi:hypothetical protein
VEANSTGGQGLRRAVAPSDDDDDLFTRLHGYIPESRNVNEALNSTTRNCLTCRNIAVDDRATRSYNCIGASVKHRHFCFCYIIIH